MAIIAASGLLLVVAWAFCGEAAADPLSLGLPLVHILPRDCGSILVVQDDDSCESLAAYGGINVTQYSLLNPLAFCGVLTPTPGSVVCVGDRLSACSNIVHTVAGDTCSSIESALGAICDVESLCGVYLSPGVRALLGSTPDWCTVLPNCTVPLSATTTDGLPSLSAVLSDITPAVAQVAGYAGHHELREFARLRTAGATQLQIIFVPNTSNDTHATNFVLTSGGSGRKLLATSSRAGQTQYPRYQYYR